MSCDEDPVARVRKDAWNLATSRRSHLLTAARVELRLVAQHDVELVRPDHVALVAGMQRIPDRYRRVLVLHYIAGLPVAEAAAQLRVPKGTALSWLHRGRRELTAHLAPGRGPGRAVPPGSVVSGPRGEATASGSRPHGEGVS